MQSKTIVELRRMFKQKQMTDSLVSELRKDKRKGVQVLLNVYDKQKKKQLDLVKHFQKMSEIENLYRSKGKHYIAGVDEAGRGPLAGPVVADAVILPKQFKLLGLTDSKKLSESQRNNYFDIIKEQSISYHISIIEREEIDRINIFEATKKAMIQSLTKLDPLPDQALIDAVNLTNLPFSSESIIKGDEKCLSISAASVLAKVSRDRLMLEIDKEYPMYDFKNNMGYGTANHLVLMEKHGISPYHRQTFAPVKNLKR